MNSLGTKAQVLAGCGILTYQTLGICSVFAFDLFFDLQAALMSSSD